MKKMIVLILLTVNLLNVRGYCFEIYNPNILNLNNDEYERIVNEEMIASVSNLEKLGIVITPFEKWSDNEPIKRRNAFELCHIIYHEGSKILSLPEDVEILRKIKESGQLEKFDDVLLNSYDGALLQALLYDNLLFFGKYNEKGKIIAGFDDNLTYGEALAIVSRLLGHDRRYTYLVKKNIVEYSENSYYDILCQIGLINSNVPFSYSSLTVNPKELNQDISAFEFMHLLNNAMYIPHLASSCMGDIIPNYRYIDFVNICTDEEMKSDYIYIQ